MSTTEPVGDPDAIADELEGVITAADAALRDDEIESIGKAIRFLRDRGERQRDIRSKLERAAEREADQ